MASTDTKPQDPLHEPKVRAWNQALKSYGTAYIFGRRARIYRYLLRVLSFMSFFIPLMVGGIVLSFVLAVESLEWFKWVAGILTVVQLGFALWSLVARWEEELGYSVESYIDNNSLWENYEKLAESKLTLKDFQTQLALLDVAYTSRQQQDIQHSVSEKEQRRGMRAGLRRFQRSCATCKLIPDSMQPKDCPTCGNF